MLLHGDVIEGVAELKRRPGNELQVHGGGTLIRTLMEHDLVDEYRLLIHPVVLGNGKRLFADGTTPTAFTLIDTTTTSRGVVSSTSTSRLASRDTARRPSREKVTWSRTPCTGKPAYKRPPSKECRTHRPICRTCGTGYSATMSGLFARSGELAGLWRSWERVSMALRRSGVRIPSAPPDFLSSE
jgi:RibD C-terminal domain